MLLAIDVGNTNIVFAILKNDELIETLRISSRDFKTYDEYYYILKQFFGQNNIDISNIEGVVISCVVPDFLFELKILSQKRLKIEPIIIDSATDLGIDIKIDNKKEVGADRLVNSVAAFEKYGGELIVIDFGTATTFDIVGEKGEYLGGVISPGINLSILALKNAAAKLPLINLCKPNKVIGKNTEDAMQSGIYWGYCALIEGMVKRIEDEYGKKLKTISTGGLSKLFFDSIKQIKYHDPDLTLTGLNLIYKMNKNNAFKS